MLAASANTSTMFQSRKKGGHDEDCLVVDDAEVLVTCVQMGTRMEDVEKPDRLVFNLDPDEGPDFKGVISATFHVQKLLGSMGRVTLTMVTGGQGRPRYL